MATWLKERVPSVEIKPSDWPRKEKPSHDSLFPTSDWRDQFPDHRMNHFLIKAKDRYPFWIHFTQQFNPNLPSQIALCFQTIIRVQSTDTECPGQASSGKNGRSKWQNFRANRIRNFYLAHWTRKKTSIRTSPLQYQSGFCPFLPC